MLEKSLVLLGYYDIKENIKKCSSSGLGKHLIENMKPETDPNKVIRAYKETKEAFDLLKDSASVPLGGINDVSDIIKRLEIGGVLLPEELLNMADFLRCIRNVKKYMEQYEFTAPLLYSLALGLESFKDTEKEIEFCIENNNVSSRASHKIEKLRNKIMVVDSKRKNALNKFIMNPINSKYLQESYFSQKNDRFVVPIKAISRKYVKGTVVESSSTGSTVYMELDSIKDFNVEIVMLSAQEVEECYEVRKRLSDMLAENIDSISAAVNIIGKYDFVFAKAKYSISIGGNEINITDNEVISLKKARHPMLGDEAVPLDIEIGTDHRALIITGPNTGGKTVTLKTVGLIIAMVQSGIMPPVGKGSSLSIFKQILVDIGDSQNIEQSLSTFSGHMKSLVEIINKTTRRTLVIIDEIGTGTDPKEGAALGIGILEEIYDRGAIILATTHYSKIKEYSEEHAGFINASMDFDKETLKPLYKLLIGIAGNSNALWISKRLGLDTKVLNRVEKIKGTHEVITPTNIRKFPKKKSRIITPVKEIPKDEVFEKGDRVIVNETGKVALVFNYDKKINMTTIFLNDEFTDVKPNRLTLDQRAENLYPDGYDLEQLFVSFKKRQLEKDIKRGGFKNLAELNDRLNDLNK